MTIRLIAGCDTHTMTHNAPRLQGPAPATALVLAVSCATLHIMIACKMSTLAPRTGNPTRPLRACRSGVAATLAVCLWAAPVTDTLLAAPNERPAEDHEAEALPDLNEWRLDPVTVPDPEIPDNSGETLSVEEILEAREALSVPPAHEDYPLVPGCEPVPGETGKLVPAEQTHHLGSRAVCLPAQWIDNFFAEEDDDFYAARTLIRVISFGRWQSRGETASGTRVNARVALPHTGDRLSLILRSDDKDDDRLAERDDVGEGELTGDESAGVVRAALRFAAWQTRMITTSLEAGVRGGDGFVRSRFRWRHALPADNWLRFSQEFYYRDNPQKRGMATELQLEHLLNDSMAIRLTSSAESNTLLRSERIGWVWSQSAAYFWRIRQRSALQVLVRAQGRSQPQWRTDTYTASVRFRRSICRPWVYYELEPFTFWPREDDFNATPGIIARLEFQFGAYR